MLSNPTAQGLVLPSQPVAPGLLQCPKLWKGLFCSVFSTGHTVSHHHPRCPHFVGEKIEGTEESGPLTLFCPSGRPRPLLWRWAGCVGTCAIWPRPRSGDLGSSPDSSLARKDPVKESHLDSTPRLQSLVFPPPERGTGVPVDSSMCTVCSLPPVNTDSDTETDTRGSQTATWLRELFAKGARGKALLEP